MRKHSKQEVGPVMEDIEDFKNIIEILIQLKEMKRLCDVLIIIQQNMQSLLQN